MPRKRAGVSLRKPSPAPETPAPETSIPESVAAESSLPVGTPAVARAAAEPPAAALSPLVAAVPVAAVPLPAATVEAFVSGAAAAAIETAANGIPSAKLRDLLKRGPEGYRELSVYLPEPLVRELSLYCMEHDIEMNRLVATAVEQHLRGAPVARGDRHAASPARTALADLSRWIREFLATRRRAAAQGRAVAAASSRAAAA
jgi:hypothetical protein